MPAFLEPLDFEKARAEFNAIFQKEFKALTGKDYEPLALDLVQTLANSMLYYLGKQWDQMNATIAQNFLDYSSGPYLEELVKLLGLSRRQKEMPVAKLEIEAKAPILLPKHTQFASPDGALAYTLEDNRLEVGANVVQVVGDKEGAWETTILENNNPLILSVKALGPFIHFQDLETDEALKTRYKNALASFSTAGSVLSYTHFANVKGVGKIKVMSLNAGEVTIYYTAKENLDAPKLIKDSLRGNTPLTDKVFIEPAVRVGATLNYTISLKDNIDQKAIFTAIEARVKELFNNLEIGQGVRVNKLASLGFVHKSVKDCEVNELPTLAQNEWLDLEGVQIQLAQEV